MIMTQAAWKCTVWALNRAQCPWNIVTYRDIPWHIVTYLHGNLDLVRCRKARQCMSKDMNKFMKNFETLRIQICFAKLWNFGLEAASPVAPWTPNFSEISWIFRQLMKSPNLEVLWAAGRAASKAASRAGNFSWGSLKARSTARFRTL